MITIDDVRNAYAAIKPFIHKTPLIYSNSLSKMFEAEVYLKAENLQKTGSFKVRGAFNKLGKTGGKRVIAASMGNHAQGVAFAAGVLGIQATIVMPVTASIVKEEATRGYGAEVILHGENFAEALNYALSQKEYVFIHAFDDDDVMAGQGTLALEIMEDLKDIDYLLVPVGGGGLIAGVSVVIKSLSPKTSIIGVQTGSAPAACQSFKAGAIIDKSPSSTIADGIAVGSVGKKSFEIIKSRVDDMLSVQENSIAMAVLLLLERKKLVVEGAGAVPLAALLENKERFKGKRVVAVLSGGNIDFTLVDRIIHKGMMTSGRIGVFEAIVEDIPGRLNVLTEIIASYRGNILHIVHDRLVQDISVGKTKVTFTVETKGREHLKRMIAEIRKSGFEAAGPDSL